MGVKLTFSYPNVQIGRISSEIVVIIGSTRISMRKSCQVLMATSVARGLWSAAPTLFLHRVAPAATRFFRVSSRNGGLEEFFPPGVLDSGETAPESVKTGRKWRVNELRMKSYSDLHKLWFVLLKERNMLLTLCAEAERQGVPMPSPERLQKVKKSMKAIKVVIGERENAIQKIEKMEWKFDKEFMTPLYQQNRLALEQNIDKEQLDLKETSCENEEAAASNNAPNIGPLPVT